MPSGSTANEICTARLSYQGKEIYGVTATSLDMTAAGDDVARVIGQFYRDVENAHFKPGEDPTGARKKREGPSPWHSLFFSGARQLEYSGGRDGWEWVAGESALWLTGIGFTVAAAISRGQATPLDRGIDNTELYQGISYGAFAAVLPLRIVAGALFSEEEP